MSKTKTVYLWCDVCGKPIGGPASSTREAVKQAKKAGAKIGTTMKCADCRYLSPFEAQQIKKNHPAYLSDPEPSVRC